METDTINVNFSNNICTAKEFNHIEDVITKYDVGTIVKTALDSTVKVINFQIQMYSKEKVGFGGDHRILVVTIQRKTNKEQEIHEFFLKAMPFDVEEQMRAIEESGFFFKETNFYKYIAPKLINSFKDQSWLAQCYLVKDSVLVFEDLKSKNFTTKDKVLDISALKVALTALAKLHASSIIAEKQQGQSFRELHPEFLQESIFVQRGKYHAWFTAGVKVIENVAKNLSLDSDCVSEICERIFSLISFSNKWQNVVCHGDAWSYNLMIDQSKPVANCVLIDFQLIRYAPATTDIAQLFYLTTKRQFREKHEEELVRFYHDVKYSMLKEANVDVELPKLEDTLNEYTELRIVGAITAALYYPVMMIEGKLCTELTKDSDGFANLLFRDRVDLVSSIMEKDSEYKDKIIEAVTELIQVYK